MNEATLLDPEVTQWAREIEQLFTEHAAKLAEEVAGDSPTLSKLPILDLARMHGVAVFVPRSLTVADAIADALKEVVKIPGSRIWGRLARSSDGDIPARWDAGVFIMSRPALRCLLEHFTGELADKAKEISATVVWPGTMLGVLFTEDVARVGPLTVGDPIAEA